MSEQEKALIARVVEMLLNDNSQPMLAKSGLLNAAYNAGIAQLLPDFKMHVSESREQA
jgi:hypothetical protein